MIALIAKMPRDDDEVEQLEELNLALGAENDGVISAQPNVWLLDPDRALEFIPKFTLLAQDNKVEFKLFSKIPATA